MGQCVIVCEREGGKEGKEVHVEAVDVLNCDLMGGQSFRLGAQQRLMCHGQLSDTICALEVARPRVGCFIMLAVCYLASQRAITQPVGCAFSAKCDFGH